MSGDFIFISYSHADSDWLERLKIMLAPLQRQGMLDIWEDTRIQPGQSRPEEIQKALGKAKIAVLLVSPDFLSDFEKCELPQLLEKARKEGLIIFWIPLRPCLYQYTDIARYQAAYDPKTPLATLESIKQEAALSQIAEKLIAVHSTSSSPSAPTSASDPKPQPSSPLPAGQVVYAETGATVVPADAPVPMAINPDTALGRYLEYVIRCNRYLQLQGIRSGGRLVHIELDHIYTQLRTTPQPLPTADKTETVMISVEEALSRHRCLVVLGNPGSGKTTLLRYLSLIYARDLAEHTHLVQDKLGSAEPRRLPILLPLRQIGRFLDQSTKGTKGRVDLFDFLLDSLHSVGIEKPREFFDAWLTKGKAIILLDGLDEVADLSLRERVSRLVEDFTQTYNQCRFVVTSRIVGYTGAARLDKITYVCTTVRDFTRDDIERFLGNWHRLIAIGQGGEGTSAEVEAAKQTRQLLQAIDSNPRIRDLAINPLLLTTIAMVHRDRKLPDRRAELYAEAVDILLGKWDEARGVQDIPILPEGQPFDTVDKRLLLQELALDMHEQAHKEIKMADLRQFLRTQFEEIVRETYPIEPMINRFLLMIEERTGLLEARGEGIYAFSHLTFQEYLAALEIAAHDDYVGYTLGKITDPWWREVILLEAGCLSIQGKKKTTRLISAIAEQAYNLEPYHNLVLAAECLRDVGSSRIKGQLEQEVQERLRRDLKTPPPWYFRWLKPVSMNSWIEQRSKAMDALVRTGAGFWTLPYGEPEWIKIPAGEFWIGDAKGESNEQPLQRIKLDAYQIARALITNAQYYLFTQAKGGYKTPDYWQGDRPPRELESHPVIRVTLKNAIDYCQWLRSVTGKPITLPSEAQWERAARGDKDKRKYPWGDVFEKTRCNSSALGLGTTTPVGIFSEGASPDGCLDMAGNVWEWAYSVYKPNSYPEKARPVWDDLSTKDRRVVWRGGSFSSKDDLVRCAFRRVIDQAYSCHGNCGFRVILPGGGDAG